MPNERLIEKRDVINIAILAIIAFVIGVYLIATTVLISQDGVFYIEQAKQFSSDPVRIIKKHPPGYPFLILAAHKCAVLFADDSSVFTWIYSAQSVTLLCRLLAMIPLYFMGKLLVGSKNSFLALLILIFLPFPTRIVCDVVREWPYLMFLSMGFFFLLWAAKHGKWWAFGLVGLNSGLGYLIRPESAQLIVYALLSIAIYVFRPKLQGVYRWKTIAALALLLIGFAIPAAPYMKCTSKIIPSTVSFFLKSFSFNDLPDKTDDPKLNTVGSISSNYNKAEIMPPNVLKALGEIFKTTGESLMWFFMPALVIGLFYWFRGNAELEELFLIITFVFTNVTVMILRYCYFQPHISQRWSLPLVTFTIFYIPVGLEVIASQLHKKPLGNNRHGEIVGTNVAFLILLAVGFSICLPKLLVPIRREKRSYREAAKWFSENTSYDDLIACPDSRISLYAGRQNFKYSGNGTPRKGDYMVKIVKESKITREDTDALRIRRLFTTLAIDKNPTVQVFHLDNYINKNISFVDFKWKRMAKTDYEFRFLFMVHETLAKQWHIKIHARVKEQDIILSPSAKQQNTFIWYIMPEPPTTVWVQNKEVEIKVVIKARPLRYNMVLDFYLPGERDGRLIDLGWIDLGADN